MAFLQSLFFFIIVKTLAYYLKSTKDESANQTIVQDVLECNIENSSAAYDQEFEPSFGIDENKDLAVKNIRPKLKYIANGKKLLCDLNRYYYLKLGLPLPIIRMDRDVIVRAYEKKMATDVDDNSDLDIVAAGNFFADRIAYLSLN
jgi:hypothetical protein